MKTAGKVIISLLIALFLLAAAAGGLYWYNWQSNPPAKPIDVKLSPSVEVGSPAKLSVLIKTPWYRKLTGDISLEAGDSGAVLSANKSIKKQGFDLSGQIWKIEGEILLFDEVTAENLTLTAELSPDREKKQQNLEVSLPPVKASFDIEDSATQAVLKNKLSESDLHSEQTQREKNHLWWWIVTAVLAVLACAIVLSTKTHARKKLKPWEAAKMGLGELKNQLNLNDEKFFVRLSDILRVYIERRFALPATEKTSEEFIQEIDRSSLLSENQQQSLKKFLSTADLIKFARADSSEEQKTSCLKMADDFISETIPENKKEASK